MRKERLSIFICADHYGTSRSNFKQPWSNTWPEEKQKYSRLFVFRSKCCSTICWSQYINTIVLWLYLLTHLKILNLLAVCITSESNNLMASPLPSCMVCLPHIPCVSAPSDSIQLEHLDSQGSCAPAHKRWPLLKCILVTCIKDGILVLNVSH